MRIDRAFWLRAFEKQLRARGMTRNQAVTEAMKTDTAVIVRSLPLRARAGVVIRELKRRLFS